MNKVLEMILLPRVSNYFGLDTYGSMALMSLSNSVTDLNATTISNFQETVHSVSKNSYVLLGVALAIILITSAVLYYFYEQISDLIETKLFRRTIIHINNYDLIYKYLEYMYVFKASRFMEFGVDDREGYLAMYNPRVTMRVNFNVIPQEDVYHNFNDKAYGISGRFMFYQYKLITKKYHEHHEEVVVTKIPMLKIIVNTDDFEKCKAYSKFVETEIEKHRNSVPFKQKGVIIMRRPSEHDKTIKTDNLTFPISEEIKAFDYVSLKKQYIDTFFHPDKENLWKAASMVHFHPEKFKEQGQAARHTIIAYGPPGTGKSTYAYRLAKALGRHIICINLNDINNKYDVLQIFAVPNPSIVGKQKPLYVLDEFDSVVERLVQRDAIKQQLRESIIKKYQESTENKISFKEALEEIDTPDDGLTLHDLLSITQGTIPIDDLMVVATSNHFEKIRNMIPALFRHGRLTPVKFDYLEVSVIDQMTMHYFGREISKDPDLKLPTQPKIPTSWYTDIIATHNDYEIFKSMLAEKLKLMGS